MVPCLVTDAAHGYPDERRNRAERDMFVISIGAAMQNFMVALAVEGLGSCYISSALFCPDVAAATMGLPAGWQPMGAIGIGHAAAAPKPRPPRSAGDFILTL